jgi:septum formation protein
MSHSRLILASGSPRRRELLSEMGLAFTVQSADVLELDATSAPHLTPLQLAQENARIKANAITSAPGQWILSADTVVALEGRVYGKPASLAQARDYLRALSGKRHQVITACLLKTPAAEHAFHDISSVTFLSFSDDTISRYLAEVPVLDKAGAYALQQRGEWLIDSTAGSRHNIIGLPTEKLATLLRHLHVDLEWNPNARSPVP